MGTAYCLFSCTLVTRIAILQREADDVAVKTLCGRRMCIYYNEKVFRRRHAVATMQVKDRSHLSIAKLSYMGRVTLTHAIA